MDAALRDEEIGAALLVEFCAQMRVNRRTRRSMATLNKAHGQTPWPRWYGVFARQVYTMMQLCRMMALPEAKAVASMISASRGMRRQLSHAGLAAGRLPPLGQQAHVRTNASQRSMAGKQVAVQFDNWYRKRCCSDPIRPDCCPNVTAMSMLHTSVIPMYPGFPTLDHLLQRIPQTAQTIAASFREFPRAVDASRRDPPETQYIRVPLDVHGDSIRSLQWYPLPLADLVSSSNGDLLHIREQCLAIQVHKRHVMPLLMDENIFYRLAKFMYSRTYNPFKLSEHYPTLPMLYDCWHPYKYVCAMIHRKFFPILGYRGQQMPTVDEEIMCHSKLLHMEKQFCALLLATSNIEDCIVPKETSIMPFREASRKLPLVWLTGLKNLLHFYIPAAFLLGNLVRDCNWDGRPAGTGRTARKVLGLSLVLIVALTTDTDCNVPYVRTICVAFLLWLPRKDAVPGRCYAEEPLEAMLSRLGSRCRAYPQMKTFDQTFDLFLSMAPPERGERKTRGQIRIGLVAIMSSRLRRFLLAIIPGHPVKPPL